MTLLVTRRVSVCLSGHRGEREQRFKAMLSGTKMQIMLSLSLNEVTSMKQRLTVKIELLIRAWLI